MVMNIEHWQQWYKSVVQHLICVHHAVFKSTSRSWKILGIKPITVKVHICIHISEELNTNGENHTNKTTFSERSSSIWQTQLIYRFFFDAFIRLRNYSSRSKAKRLHLIMRKSISSVSLSIFQRISSIITQFAIPKFTTPSIVRKLRSLSA